MFQSISKVRYFYCVQNSYLILMYEQQITLVIMKELLKIESILNITSNNTRYKSNANLYHCIHPITLLPWD